MPIKPWTMAPKKSLGIFEGLGNVLDARDQRNAAKAQQQITLEDRLNKQHDRDAANKSRTIEDALHQAQAAALTAKPPATPEIHGTTTDPVNGKVYVIYKDGSYAEARPHGGASPVAASLPPMGGPGHENDDEEHGGPQSTPAVPSPSLSLGVKKPPKDPVLREVGGDLYDVTDPKNPVLVQKVPPKGPPDDNTLVPVQQEDGSVVYTPRSKAVGARVPSPSNTGSASMQKAVAANETQLSVIDDALKELDTHPAAVGLQRGLPWVGAKLDQRIDPNGVAARAQISNIGSLKIHDRSGAAVSVHEFPRLAPFIPAVDDTPETVRIKLGKLRAAIELETSFLRGGKGPSKGATPAKPGGVTPSSDPEFDALMAKYGKRP